MTRATAWHVCACCRLHRARSTAKGAGTNGLRAKHRCPLVAATIGQRDVEVTGLLDRSRSQPAVRAVESGSSIGGK